MKYIRFTCEECGITINKSYYKGNMDCPRGHGIMRKRMWSEFSFYLIPLFFLYFMIFLLIIFKK